MDIELSDERKRIGDHPGGRVQDVEQIADFPIALLEKGDEGVQLNLPMAMLVWGRPVRTQGTQRPANPLIVVQRRWCMAQAIDETV